MEINNNLSVGANRDARIAELEAEVERWRQRTVESAADVVTVQAEVEQLKADRDMWKRCAEWRRPV